MNTTKNNFIRNIAMIGHVSHDKNTLLIQNRKVTYGDYKINFIDIFDSTDFDGKVEHTLQMVEGFLLFIDASEDVLPETRFVLRKALKFKLKPIVVINKTNKKDVAIDALESSIHDLFLDFAIDTDQLDFPILYTLDKNKIDENLKQLFETIIFFISAPTSRTDLLDNAYVPINEPTMTIFLSVNDSPFSGREGTLLTACQIKDRLDKESKTNKTLKIESTNYPELFKISGPNMLHFTALIENMRQEGFELQISAPQVMYKTINGKIYEPIEDFVIDLPQKYQNIVVTYLDMRKAEMKNITNYHDGRVCMEYQAPTRALLGFRSQFIIDTQGTGIVSFSFNSYRLYEEAILQKNNAYQLYNTTIPQRTKGAIVSTKTGFALERALDWLRRFLDVPGTLFIFKSEPVYEGMIIGENSNDHDKNFEPYSGNVKGILDLNVKYDDIYNEIPFRVMKLEECLEWIRSDELIEVTPKNIRLRKKKINSFMAFAARIDNEKVRQEKCRIQEQIIKLAHYVGDYNHTLKRLKQWCFHWHKAERCVDKDIKTIINKKEDVEKNLHELLESIEASEIVWIAVKELIDNVIEKRCCGGRYCLTSEGEDENLNKNYERAELNFYFLFIEQDSLTKKDSAKEKKIKKILGNIHRDLEKKKKEFVGCFE